MGRFPIHLRMYAIAIAISMGAPDRVMAQATERPWLDGLPIAEQSLDLPPPRTPDLEQACTVPDSIAAMQGDPEGGPYADPRYIGWIRLYHQCKWKDLFAALEADLASGNPHPLASLMWSATRHSQNPIGPDWRNGLDPALIAGLGRMPDIYRGFVDAADGATTPDLYRFAHSVSAEEALATPFAAQLLIWLVDDVHVLDLPFTPRQTLERNPAQFISWWETLRGDKRNVEEVDRLIGPGGPLASHFFAPMLRAYVLDDRDDDAFRVEMADAWLARYPNDRDALRFKATALRSLGHTDREAELRTRAADIAPFFIENMAARPHYALDRFEDGDRVLALAQESEDRRDWYYLNNLRNAGLVHQMRSGAARVLARNPSNHPVRRLLAQSYADAGQTALALAEARKLWAEAPANWGDARLYVSALRAEGLAREALAAFDEARSRLGKVNSSLLWQALQAAQSLDDDARQRALLDMGKSEAIAPMWLLRQEIAYHERKGANDKVVSLSRALLAGEMAYRSDYASFYKAAHALRGVAGVDEAFAWARDSSLNPNEAYQAAVERLREFGADARADAVLAEAMARFPDRFWPVYLTQKRAGQIASLPDMESRERAIRDRLPNYVGEDREWAIRNLAIILREGYQQNLISRERLAEVEPLFSEAVPAMTAKQAANNAGPFYEALGEPEKAIALWNADATNNRHGFDPFVRLRLKSDTAPTDAFAAIWRSISEDRFNAQRLTDYIASHALWGGSPILGACLGEWVDANFPEAVPVIAARRDAATNRFGGDEEYFRRRYANATAIAKSERYIGWYQDVKRKALAGGKYVDFDCRRGVVTTVDRNGDLEVWQENYRTGKLSLLAQGSAWLRYDYNVRGDLTRLYTSDGRDVRLDYNANGKIVRMTDSRSGSVLDFEYGPAGKPTKIVVAGIGYLQVEYDDRGEILKVNGFEPNGTEGGYQIAGKVTEAFQNLLALAKPEQSKALLEEDVPAVASLRNRAYAAASTLVDVRDAATTFAAVRKTNKTSSSTMHAVDDIMEWLLQGGLAGAPADSFASVGGELHALYSAISPFGLPENRWSMWSEFLRLAEARAGEKPVAAMLAAIRRDALAPMVDRSASNLDELRNPGYWYLDTPDTFLPAGLRGNLSYSAVTVRGNGDMVVAANSGLLVKRQGNWERYAFRAERNAWARDDLGELAADPIEVSSLVDLPSGHLAVGTNRGVYVLGEDYVSVLARAGTGVAGMPAGLVNDMLVLGDTLYVAAGGGVGRLSIAADGALGAGEPLSSTGARALAEGPDGWVIASGEGGVVGLRGGAAVKIAGLVAKDAAYSPEDRRLIILDRGRLLSAQFDGNGFSPPVELTHASSARIGAEGWGLIQAEIGGRRSVLALGQEGYAVWQNGYFSHFALPYASGFPAARAAWVSSDVALVAGGDGGLYRFEPRRTGILASTPVYASAYDPETDIAYFATGQGITAALPSALGAEPQIVTFAYVSARHLDIGPDGALIANDGQAVLRYPRGSTQAEVLFDARAYCPSDFTCQNGIAGLLAASDGSIWATSGGSAFRYRDGAVTEYSWFKDPSNFPVDTHWLGALLELPDGSVMINASNEAHLNYRGDAMRGQNLVWRNGRFETFENGPMFTSLTNVDGRAILGSTSGFYEADSAGVYSLAGAKDPSYLALRGRHPNLYLAGEAARIANDVLLFPTPAGLVAYQNDAWFYPERLNWQYPDPAKADIGARHTYTVQVDKAGRIYAGTDRGLLVFQRFGGDAVDFLVENDRADLAFASFERRKLRKEADSLLNGIDAGSPKFAALQRLGTVKQDIDRLQQRAMDPIGALGGVGSDASARPAPGLIDGAHLGPPPGSTLANEIAAKEREYTRLLAELERDDPGLVQLVNIKPLELSALQSKIPEGAVIVQYIPLDSKLLLHVISRRSHRVEEIAIKRETLMKSALDANRFLNSLSARVDGLVAEGDSIFASGDAADLPADTPIGDLAGLYEILFAPIETEIAGFERVYISAAGGLNYVPFTALIRKRDGGSEYAAERFAMAMVPTSYLLSLVLQDDGAASQTALIFGNPDGTLPGSQMEAGEVGDQISQRLTDVVLRIGNEADLATLEQYGANTRMLHLATHGKLNPDQPERSYVVLGDKKRLDMIGIMTLNLDNTEFAFLSACETALGADGLEYGTLARAFAHAGVPTTIASLWKVGDRSTLELVKRFYGVYDGDAMLALQKAQKSMISTSGPLAHPAAWAPFQVFGRGFEK